MKKTMKRVLSILLALVMVITAINYTPKTVNAADATGKTSQNVTELATPTDAVLYDYRQAGGQYVIEFTDGDSDMTIVDGDSKEFAVWINGIQAATVTKSGDTIDASLIDNLGLTEGTSYEVKVQEIVRQSGVETPLTSAESTGNYTFTYDPTPIEALSNDVPQIFVTTVRNGGTANVDLFQTGSDKTKVDSTIVVKTSNGAAVECSDTGTIALRGNSTAGADKKPYNIKFSNKHDLFGLSGDGKGEKKWSLLANAFDKSLIRNQIGIQFHNYMETFQNHQYTSSCLPVDLYVDGKYLGSYLLIESVDEGSTRVDIDSENENNNEILLELDSTLRDIAKDAHLGDLSTSTAVKTKKFEKAFTINEPGGPGNTMNPVDHEDQAAYEKERDEFAAAYQGKSDRVLAFLNAFEATLPENDTVASDINEINKYIDLDSFVNYYITAELFKIKDVDYSSVRFYIKEVDGTDGGILEANDGKYYKMYAGPLWDLDLSCGNDENAEGEGSPEQMKAQTNPWFAALMRNEDFQKLVAERYEEALPKIKALYADNGTIDTVATAIAKSANANYTVAYDDDNEADVNNTDAQTDPGYGSGWGYLSTDSDSGRATLGGVHGKIATSEDYQTYVDEFKTWMQARNEYLMKQLGVSDKNATYTEYEDMVADKYYNLALDKNTTIYKNIHQEGNQKYINDGLFTNGKAPLTNADTTDAWGTENQPTYFTIDLGAVYKASAIEQILIQYVDNVVPDGTTKDNNTVQGRPYKILFAIDDSDDSNFYEVIDVEAAELDDNYRTIDTFNAVSTLAEVDVTDSQLVRYVRVYYPETAGYGMQITEAAILDTDKDAEAVAEVDVAEPTATATVTEGTYNTITGTVTAAEGVTDGTTYAIYVDGVLVTTLDAAGEFTLTDIEAGEHTVTVKAKNAEGWYSDVVTAGTVTVEDDPNAEPDYYDLELVKVDVDYEEFAANQAITMTATIKNVGKSFEAGTGQLTMHVVNDSGAEDANLTGGSWSIVGSPAMTYGETITYTWTGTITETLVNQGYVNFRITPEGGLANQDSYMDNNYFTYNFGGVVNTVTNLSATTKDGETTATVTWTAPDTENTYSYNVYVDGELKTETPITETTFTTATLTDGTHTVEVTAVLNDKESKKVSTSALIYSSTNATWATFDSITAGINSVDTYGNTWYVAKDYLNYSNLNFAVGANYFGLNTDPGVLAEQPMFEICLTGVTGNSMKTVTINGTTYTIGTDTDYVTMDNDRVFVNQSLFQLADDEKEKVFAITISASTDVSFLIKVERGVLDAPIGLAHNPTDTMEHYFAWQAVTGAVSYNFYITDEAGNVTTYSTTEALYNAEEYFANAVSGRYTIGVTAVDSFGTESEMTTISYPHGVVEPENYDLQLVDVAVEYASLTQGETIKMTATVKNVGKSIAAGDLKLVMHVVNDSNAEDGQFTGGSYSVVNKDGVELFEFPYGEEVTWTWTGTIQEALVNQGYIKFRATLEGTIAGQDANMENNFVTKSLSGIEAPTNLKVDVDQDTKSADISWDAVEGATAYNVYIDGILDGTVTDGTTYTAAELATGTHTVEVKAAAAETESMAVSGIAQVYGSVADEAWKLFSDINAAYATLDANGNTWYIAENVLDYTAVNVNAGVDWFGLKEKDGRKIFEICMTGEGGASITSVIINGVKYTTGANSDLITADGDRILVDQSLFDITGYSEKEFVITTVGTNTKSFVVKVAKSAPVALAWAGNDELKYYWSWQAALGSNPTSYNVYVMDEEGNVVHTVEGSATAAFNGAEYFATAEVGTYTIGVEAVYVEGDVTSISEMSTVTYKVSNEPEYYDLTLDKVEATFDDLVADNVITLTATITNNGKSFAVDGNNYKPVLHFVTDTATGQNGDALGTLLGQDWQIVEYANSGLVQNADGSYQFNYGDTITYTYTRNITQAFIDQGYARIRLTLEGVAEFAAQDNNIADNYYTYEVPGIGIPQNVKATVNADKTATVTWDAPDDAYEYTYNVYVDGVLQTTAALTDKTYTTAALADGDHTISVTAVYGSGESKKAAVVVFPYTDLTTDEWSRWEDAFGNADQYSNPWYYYTGYDWNKVVTNAGAEWFGLKNNGHYNAADGTSYVTGDMAGKAVFEVPVTGEEGTITSVIVNGTTYTVAANPDKMFTVGNRVYLNQDIFALEDTEKEKVFAITVVGNDNTSFLVRVTNTSYTDFDFSYNEEVGADVAEWPVIEVDGVKSTSYTITYTVGGVETTVTVDNANSYTFKDADGNAIFPDNGTQVLIQSYDADGNAIGEQLAAVALADLVITDVVEPEVVVIGEDSKATVQYKNIGTAAATYSTADYEWQAVMIRGTEGSNYYMEPKVLLPGENMETEVTFNFVQTTGYVQLTAEVDEGNRVYESNASNNTMDFTVYVVEQGTVDIAYSEEVNCVEATWKKLDEDVEAYYFVYTSNGQEVTNYIDTRTTEEGGHVTRQDDETYTCNVYTAMDPGTTFRVYAKLTNGNEVIIGAETAYPDLIITNVVVDADDKIQVGYEFDSTVTVKNVGTAQIPAKSNDSTDVDSEEWQEGYAKNTVAVSVTWTGADGNADWNINDGYTDGLAVGQVVDLRLTEIAPTVDGEDLPFTYWVDHYGYDGGGFVEFHVEHNDNDPDDAETNNTKEVTYDVAERQQIREMDWIRMTSAGFAGEPAIGEDYLFPVASGSQKAYIDYKILDTTNEDKDFEDIINKALGYQGANMSVGFDIANVVTSWNDANNQNHSETVIEFAQVPEWNEFVEDENGNIVYETDADGNYVLDAEGNMIPLETTPDPNSKDLCWINLATQGTDIHLPDGTTVIKHIDGDSPVSYNGNGFNFFVGNFGLYKCYIIKLTTPRTTTETITNEDGTTTTQTVYVTDENGNQIYDYTTVAFRVTDDKIRTNNWMQALDSDGVSNPDTLPIPYCGGDSWAETLASAGTTLIGAKHELITENFVDNTDNTDNEHEATEGSQNYDTIGALWYDASDIMLSSISVYNGNWLSIATSQYLQFDRGGTNADGTAHYRVGIARAHTIPEQNNAFIQPEDDANFDGFVVTDPNQESAHLGIQGTNTIHVGLPWLLQELPTHSDLGGQKDTEYYWIRIWADIETPQETVIDENGNYTQLANYVDIPITVYYDVPQIQPAQSVTAITTYDDNDKPVFSLSWGALDEMNTYGYKYKVFYTNKDGEDVDISLALAQTSGLVSDEYDEAVEGSYYYDSPQVLTSNAQLYSDVVSVDESNLESGTLKVVAYWCEQEIEATAEIQPAHNQGWYAIDGESTIGIQAGKRKPVEVPGYISYYYDQTVNHASAVVGYNGYFLSLNGNTKYFAADSTVSVYRGCGSRSEMEAIYNKLYEKEGYDPDTNVDINFNEVVVDYNYIDGQLQIEAKDIMTASNLVTWYMVKVETPISAEEAENATGEIIYDEEGNAKYVAYIMMESIVEAGGDVAVRGFQMNTDSTPGGVSEYSPSFRVVSRASKIVADNTDAVELSDAYNMDPTTNELATTPLYTTGTQNSAVEAIVAQGTIYGQSSVADELLTVSVKDEEGNVVKDENGNIVVSTDEAAGVYQIPTTAGGVLTAWSGAANDTDASAYTYYAVTFKPMKYSVKTLKDTYNIKAYMVTEEGDIVYESEETDPVKTASVYTIAEVLYSNGDDATSTARMANAEDHKFLYDNVLNINAIADNYTAIGKAMLSALSVTSKDSDEYKYVNETYKDLYYYAHLAMHYSADSYIKRGDFIARNEGSLLPLLNGVKKNSETDYATIADWIYGEIDHTSGFYEKVEYVTPDNDGTVENAGESV